jgi:Ca2+-binding EF-hand superfamily protein
MGEKNTTEEELFARFKLYDSNGSGFIEQTDFKTVLG